MPSIQDLSPELIGQIVDLIRLSCPETLDALSKVNTAFRKEAIDGSFAIQEEKIWHLLYDSIPRMTGLRYVLIDLKNNYVFKGLIKALQYRPDVRLDVGMELDECPSEGNMLALLQNNLNLYSICVVYRGNDARDFSKLMKLLKIVLLTCPQLRHLEFRNRISKFPDHQYYGFGFANNERPPALHSLELFGYPFGNDGSNPNIVTTIGYQGQEEHYWANNFDWSQMRRLNTQHIGMILQCLHKFTSLKEIVLEAYDYEDTDTKRLFQLVPSILESITVPFMDAIGIEGILRHGSKLRILHVWLKPKPSWGSSQLISSMDATTIRRIRDSCPYIEELALSLNRGTMWSNDTLNILASFPKLHTLTLDFQPCLLRYDIYDRSFTGISVRDDAVQESPTVYLTMSTVQQLFKYLLQTSPTARPSALRKLHVKYRLPPVFDPGEDGINCDWFYDNDVSFECKLSERDVDKHRGIFSVTCQDLVEKENAILQDALNMHKDPAQILLESEDQIKAVNCKFKVAWYGPLPLRD
ncbi:hypothetical protein F4815DRAFT_449744 [Daldinia loculata]|nr:hypothetical protein F4815DRAFT_449744 [Daldinia loculata]